MPVAWAFAVTPQKLAHGPKVGFDRGMAEEIVTRDEIRAMRRSYSDAGLETLPSNPFEAFALW